MLFNYDTFIRITSKSSSAVGSSNHMTGTAEPIVVKIFYTGIGYINSSNRMTYYQQKGRGYGHVTVLQFCRLSLCSASRGFVSDSWATCLRWLPSTILDFWKVLNFNCRFVFGGSIEPMLHCVKFRVNRSNRGGNNGRIAKWQLNSTHVYSASFLWRIGRSNRRFLAVYRDL